MGLDWSALGIFLFLVCSIGSFMLGRHFSRGWRERRRAKEQAAVRAQETRQQRRARERRERLP